MKILWQWLHKNPKWTFVMAMSWTIIICIGCLMPGKELPKVDLFDNFDKVVHFIFFAVFFILWYSRSSLHIRSAILILSISILFGFGIEFYQKYFVAGRSFDVWDGVADTLGAIVGYSIVRRLMNR